MGEKLRVLVVDDSALMRMSISRMLTSDSEIEVIATAKTGRDAIEMMMAGASAVGIGTGIYYRGMDIFNKVCDEMKEFLESNGYSNLKEIVGLVHRD